MNIILVLVSLLLHVIQVHSETLDYFIMSEAHIGEFRAYEDANSGYAPFYIKCADNAEHADEKVCAPGTPIIYERDGIVAIKSHSPPYYGCMDDQDMNEIFNSKELKKKVFMKKARRVHFVDYMETRGVEMYYVNIYKYKCQKEVTPTMWLMPYVTPEPFSFYSIGFKIDGYGEMGLAEVYYDYQNHIPIRTRHTVYGASIASPPPTFKSVESLQFGDDFYTLLSSMNSYHKFDVAKYKIRENFNTYLTNKGLSNLKGKLVMAHLIPEYDMVLESWKGIANFAHTIAPMWMDLYVGVWADIENAIREAAFMRQTELTVYTGTHGRLTFDTDLPKLFALNENKVPVPEVMWKLVIDERYSKSNNRKAIAIMLRNVPDEMIGSNTFTQYQPPCETLCVRLEWLRNPPLNLHCCAVQDVQDIITEFPTRVQSETYDLLNKVGR